MCIATSSARAYRLKTQSSGALPLHRSFDAVRWTPSLDPWRIPRFSKVHNGLLLKFEITFLALLTRRCGSYQRAILPTSMREVLGRSLLTFNLNWRQLAAY